MQWRAKWNLEVVNPKKISPLPSLPIFEKSAESGRLSGHWWKLQGKKRGTTEIRTPFVSRGLWQASCLRSVMDEQDNALQNNPCVLYSSRAVKKYLLRFSVRIPGSFQWDNDQRLYIAHSVHPLLHWKETKGRSSNASTSYPGVLGTTPDGTTGSQDKEYKWTS